jgi:hypothetical protein
MEFATTQNDAALRFFLQHQKRIQRVADCGEGQFIVDRFNDPRRGSTAIEKDGLMRLHETRRQLGGATFFINQTGFLIAD